MASAPRDIVSNAEEAVAKSYASLVLSPTAQRRATSPLGSISGKPLFSICLRRVRAAADPSRLAYFS